jgi:hypothetical protein
MWSVCATITVASDDHVANDIMNRVTTEPAKDIQSCALCGFMVDARSSRFRFSDERGDRIFRRGMATAGAR